jgi:hypothetical protein
MCWQDHGPINSWDRQPYLTTVRTGEPSLQMAWRDVTRNLIIANYGGFKEVDNDDGSLFYRVHANVMFFGWAQKFKCGAIYSHDNLKWFIQMGGKRSNAGCLLGGSSITAEDGVVYPHAWHNDTMSHLGSAPFEYRVCWNSRRGERDWDKEAVHNNTIYVQSAAVEAMISDVMLRARAAQETRVRTRSRSSRRSVSSHGSHRPLHSSAQCMLHFV